MLTGELKGFAAVQRLEATKHLVVVAGGPPPPDPAELLANPRLKAALVSMSSQSDLVVVDAPPLLAVTDPTLIAQHCDATIMVAIAGDSDRREWAEALQRLALVKANVIGTVLMQPDDRANATTSYRYAPSAEPKDWWVAGSSAAETAETATSSPDDVAADDAAALEPQSADEPAEGVDIAEPAVPDAETVEPAAVVEPAETTEAEAQTPEAGDVSGDPVESDESDESVASAEVAETSDDDAVSDVWPKRRERHASRPADQPAWQDPDS
jgi:hypothetical protein